MPKRLCCFNQESRVRALHPAAQGSNLTSADFSLLLSLWTEEISNPSSAYATDFTAAVSGKGLSLVFTKMLLQPVLSTLISNKKLEG